tara:strand:+ start:288 stop:713 length:426 start_codon:yes stop_codon:yes gene_type:complete
MTRPGGVSSSPGLSQDQLWIKSTVDASQTFSQARKPGSGSINLSPQLLHLTLLFVRASLSTHIGLTKRVNVAIILGEDQTVQVLVIEALAFVSLDACDFVIVQVDLYLAAITIEQSVILFCFAGIFHNCVLYPWLFIGLCA